MPNKPDMSAIEWDAPTKTPASTAPSRGNIEWDAPQQTQPGLFRRIGSDVAQRAKSIGEELQLKPGEGEGAAFPGEKAASLRQTIAESPRRGLNITGELAGAVGDPIAEILKSLYTTVVPQSVQTGISTAWEETGQQSQRLNEERVAKYNAEHPGANLRARTMVQGMQEDISPENLKLLGNIANIAALAAGSKLPGKEMIGGKVPSRISELNVGRLDLSKLPADVAERVRVARAAGVDVSPAALKQTKPLAQLESMLDKNIASSGIAEKAYKENIAQAEQYAKSIQKGFGGKATMQEAGETAQSFAKGRYGAFMQKAQQLYKDIPVAAETLVETNNLRDVAIGQLDELGKIDAPAMKRILNIAKESVEPQTAYKPGTIVSASGQPFTGGNLPKYTWQELMADRNSLNQMWRQSADPNRKRIIGGLVNAIDDDIAKFSTTTAPGVKQAFDKALNFYKFGDEKIPGVRTFRDRQIKSMIESTSTEDVVNKFIKPNNVSDITRLASATGPEGMQPIKQAWLDKLLTKGEEQSFSPRKFATAFDKYDAVTLKAFLTTEEMDGLKTLSSVSKLLNKAEQIAGNPSGTAQHVITSGYMFSLLNHPIMTIATGLGSNRFAKLYFENPAFRRALVEGIQAKANSKKAIASAANMSTEIAKATGNLAPVATTASMQNNPPQAKQPQIAQKRQNQQ